MDYKSFTDDIYFIINKIAIEVIINLVIRKFTIYKYIIKRFII